MPDRHEPLTDSKPDALIKLFFPEMSAVGTFSEVPAAAVPPPWSILLAHHDHMTVMVERFYKSPVDVVVLQQRSDPANYSRAILLKTADKGRIVQFGIVRISRSALDPAIMREIESGTTPLGRILIEHNVMRKVRLKSLWRIEPGSELQRHFNFAPSAEPVCYGRTAMIYANHLPAIELLEIVA